MDALATARIASATSFILTPGRLPFVGGSGVATARFPAVEVASGLEELLDEVGGLGLGSVVGAAGRVLRTGGGAEGRRVALLAEAVEEDADVREEEEEVDDLEEEGREGFVGREALEEDGSGGLRDA